MQYFLLADVPDDKSTYLVLSINLRFFLHYVLFLIYLQMKRYLT